MFCGICSTRTSVETEAKRKWKFRQNRTVPIAHNHYLFHMYWWWVGYTFCGFEFVINHSPWVQIYLVVGYSTLQFFFFFGYSNPPLICTIHKYLFVWYFQVLYSWPIFCSICITKGNWNIFSEEVNFWKKTFKIFFWGNYIKKLKGSSFLTKYFSTFSHNCLFNGSHHFWITHTLNNK